MWMLTADICRRPFFAHFTLQPELHSLLTEAGYFDKQVPSSHSQRGQEIRHLWACWNQCTRANLNSKLGMEQLTWLQTFHSGKGTLLVSHVLQYWHWEIVDSVCVFRQTAFLWIREWGLSCTSACTDAAILARFRPTATRLCASLSAKCDIQTLAWPFFLCADWNKITCWHSLFPWLNLGLKSALSSPKKKEEEGWGLAVYQLYKPIFLCSEVHLSSGPSSCCISHL